MGAQSILTEVQLDLAPYEDLYKYFHAHPEISNEELNTAETVRSHLAQLKTFEIHTKIGGHGLVGIHRNGPGKTVLLRADMDALPVSENTSLPYSSTVNGDKPAMHACGHDMHMTCLLAASQILTVKLRESWTGTLIVLFQPAEERGTGAQAMLDNGLYDKIPIPDYILGQHVMGNLRTGTVGLRSGTIMAGADSLKCRIYGRGGHGSQPHRTIDPTVIAAHAVVRLQSIVSREIDPNDIAVVTVGSLSSGQTENIIPDSAEIGIDMRSVQPATREKMLASIRRIVKAECDASGATEEPTFTPTRRLGTTVNDESMTNTLNKCFTKAFGQDFDPDIPITTIAEDFSVLAQGRPSAFWHFGATEAGSLEGVAMNHSSGFAPVIQPTMRTGVNALVVAALTFFEKDGTQHKL